MRIGLASPAPSTSLDDALSRIDRLLADAAGAKVVFHPRHTGSITHGVRLTASAPYYEKAMVMRSNENTIYFASVNYALRFQESATCVITPDGRCQALLPYGDEGGQPCPCSLPAVS